MKKSLGIGKQVYGTQEAGFASRRLNCQGSGWDLEVNREFGLAFTYRD
jgi:hypothetical protein